MGSNSQRRKQRQARLDRQARKRQGKRSKEKSRGGQPVFRRVAAIALGSNSRHRQRLALQVPRAWEGETLVDTAVFDDAVFAALPQDDAQQVAVVREALAHATANRGDEALKCTSVIARSSPLSEWRLFVRGLVDWLANDTAAAEEAWKRLDAERRPGRIATALMLALRTDLDVVTSPPLREPGAEPSQPSPWDAWDEQLLYHAKLVRRVRFDRAALRIAEAGTRAPEESNDLLIGFNKLHWLREFIKEYGDTESDLAAALAQTAIGRAAAQTYSNLFDEVSGHLPGPRHDRRNKLLTFFYYSRFDNDFAAERKAEQALKQYLNNDLPKNEALTPAIRGAIASHIHLLESLVLIRPRSRGGLPDFLFDTSREDTKSIREHLHAAVQAYPRNLVAYKTHATWIEDKLDDERLNQKERAPLEKELAGVMQQWADALPDCAEPRLWLVDYLLENDQLEAAKPHVDYLAASRQEDPRVRAAPWKWQMLETMRLSRRKAGLADVPSRLDAAETIWPTWLPKQWLAYFRAAWALRMGQAEIYEIVRRQICEDFKLKRDSLADACMMLGAAQHLYASAAQLKPLRAPVDEMLKQPDKLPHDELAAVGAFFWDMHRARLVYPAYRMHGAKFGKALLARWKANPQQVVNRRENEAIQKALLWCSEFRFWPNNYDISFPPFYSSSLVKRHPMFAAARLSAFLKTRYHWGIETYREDGPLLRAAASTQRDAYYRYWFAALANELDEELAKESSRSVNSFFGSDDDDDDDDEDDDEFEDDFDFDPDCDCPECQAARRRHEQAKSEGFSF
jgi:hypothetical protein